MRNNKKLDITAIPSLVALCTSQIATEIDKCPTWRGESVCIIPYNIILLDDIQLRMCSQCLELYAPKLKEFVPMFS